MQNRSKEALQDYLPGFNTEVIKKGKVTQTGIGIYGIDNDPLEQDITITVELKVKEGSKVIIYGHQIDPKPKIGRRGFHWYTKKEQN